MKEYRRSVGVNGADLRDTFKDATLMSPKVPYFRMSGETHNRNFSLSTLSCLLKNIIYVFLILIAIFVN